MANTKDMSAIQIIDYGVGMNPEQLQMLRSNEPTTSTMGTMDEKGTGLGLSFCRDYLRKAGAELIVDSAPGKGSTFTISIAR